MQHSWYINMVHDQTWFVGCRQATPELAGSHVQSLHNMVVTLAQCCHGHGSDAKCDQANQQMLSHSLQQLVQLTAHLLLALPLDLRQHLAHSLLQVSQFSISTLGQHVSLSASGAVMADCFLAAASTDLRLM